MATRSIGFAVEDADRDRLDRLVQRYGGGNRSAFLRVAMAYMESVERAERLKRLQAYGAERAATRSLDLDDVDEVVHRVLKRRRRR